MVQCPLSPPEDATGRDVSALLSFSLVSFLPLATIAVFSVMKRLNRASGLLHIFQSVAAV